MKTIKIISIGLLTVFLLLQLQTSAYSQGVAINTTGIDADPSSMLDVSSTDKGVLISRMSTAQRNAIASPAQGLWIYNTTTQCFEFYENSNWNTMGCTCTVPDIPVSIAGSGATETQITANWNAASGAASYSIDVSTVIDFSSFVAGYNDLNVGAVTTYDVTGLTCNTTYYYRIRAVNACGTTGSSNAITYTTSVCFSCGSSVTFTYKGSSAIYGTVSNNGECWLDRNLGASQVATAYNDAAAFGDLIQWGRLDDGHQSRTSGTTSTNSGSDIPGHSNFITENTNPYDWRVPQNDNLWQGVSGINNPCPSGWRIPTDAELETERASWSSNNYNGAFASPLKLTAAGLREETGVIGFSGYGFYGCSTVIGSNVRGLLFSNVNAYFTSNYRAYGVSVRCIKN